MLVRWSIDPFHLVLCIECIRSSCFHTPFRLVICRFLNLKIGRRKKRKKTWEINESRILWKYSNLSIDFTWPLCGLCRKCELIHLFQSICNCSTCCCWWWFFLLVLYWFWHFPPHKDDTRCITVKLISIEYRHKKSFIYWMMWIQWHTFFPPVIIISIEFEWKWNIDEQKKWSSEAAKWKENEKALTNGNNVIHSTRTMYTCSLYIHTFTQFSIDILVHYSLEFLLLLWLFVRIKHYHCHQ